MPRGAVFHVASPRVQCFSSANRRAEKTQEAENHAGSTAATPSRHRGLYVRGLSVVFIGPLWSALVEVRLVLSDIEYCLS